jgi:trans-aconitate 2-methyltransferase
MTIELNNNHGHSWDAETYDKVSSTVQLEWGRKLLEKRKWIGNEIVMDAGAGSGKLTKILANRLPHGKVYAIDADHNMIQQAKSSLSSYKNVQVIQSSMDKVNLPTKVDVIFSNSALHWILNQETVFSHFWQLLKPNGGELLIECDGYGNLDRISSIVFKIMQSDEFRRYFANWKQSWYFPKPDDTERLLQQIGFRDILVYLSDRTMVYPDLEGFTMFVKSVTLRTFLGYLPNSQKKEQFLNSFLNEFKQSGREWSLDFMRLSVFARKS